jgi:hypothetical protein
MNLDLDKERFDRIIAATSKGALERRHATKEG